jgi:hypothetical protein
LVDVGQLREIADIEFADIVLEALIPEIHARRIILTDGSVVDIWFSLRLSGRYSVHWERRSSDGTIYRHDNAPHQRGQSVVTFPRHVHHGSEANVSDSHISEVPEEA